MVTVTLKKRLGAKNNGLLFCEMWLQTINLQPPLCPFTQKWIALTQNIEYEVYILFAYPVLINLTENVKNELQKV